jgi:predicted ribosome quality control (RQC) complex YloA/Tae2 family protein
MSDKPVIPERWRERYATANGPMWHNFDWSPNFSEAVEELATSEAASAAKDRHIAKLLVEVNAAEAALSEAQKTIATLRIAHDCECREKAHWMNQYVQEVRRKTRTVERIELSPGGYEMHVIDEIEVDDNEA